MSDIILGCIGIGATVFLGLVAIALGIFFGLRGFSSGIKDELTNIKINVAEIHLTAQNMWDVIRRNPIFVPGGTVVRELKNIGTVRITAEPHLKETVYFIEVPKHILDGERLSKLSKETGLEQKEVELFKKPVEISTSIPTRLLMKIPCDEPQICTSFVSYFLKWLDSKYFESLPRIERFEEPIQV